MKKKNNIGPNEASLGRWIAVLVVGLIIGFALFTPLAPFVKKAEDTFMGIGFAEIFTLLSFAAMFVGMVIAIKLVGKTSLKDFVLGVGGRFNKKECLTIMGLYAAGLVISFLPNTGNIYLRGVKVGEFGFLVLFMLLTTWMQTTLEELIFRGLMIRWACKNDVGFTKKAVIVAVASSVVFALGHATNPEVTSQSGIRIAMAVISYTIPGMVCFFANLYFGNLMPGIIMHWVNNFTLFTLIASEVTVMPVPTLLVDSTPHTAEWMLASNLVAYIPVLVYIFLDARKKRNTAAAC